MKHIFILNPAAGRINAFEQMENELKQVYAADGIDYMIYVTKAPGDATAYIRDYCRTHPEPTRFYACGGDGTLNEVVNGAVGFEQVSVGCYPCGSGNDFVKYYGGKQHFLNLQAQIEATEHTIDLIRIGNRYAINAAHFGFDSYVAKTMMNVRRKKLIGGKNAYTTGVIVGLFKGMNNKCRVTVDGRLLNPSGKLLLCTIANGQYVGGSFRCAPRSVDCDGMLEVCLVRPVSYLAFMRMIRDYTNGTHLDNPKFEGVLEYCRGRQIEVEAPEGFLYSFDGELVMQNKFTVEVAHRALRFAVPKGAAPIVSPEFVPQECVEEEMTAVR